MALRPITIPRFVRSVLFLAGGTAAAQGLLLVVSPLLARLYTPADFGAFAVYLSILGVVNAVSSLRYEFAIPLPDTDAKAVRLLWVAAGSVGVVSFLTLAGLLVGRGWLFEVTNTARVTSLFWIIPLSVLAMGTFKVLSYWKIRRKEYRDIAVGRSVQGAGAAAAQVGFGALVGGAGGLLGGHLLGYGLGSALLAWSSRRAVGASSAGVSVRRLADAAASARRFPLFSSWAALFNVASSQAPVLLLAGFFGSVTTGLYAMAQRLLQAPISMLAQALSQAFLGDAATLRHDGLARRVWSVFDVLLLLGLPLFVLGALVAPMAFEAVLGAEWSESGRYATLLMPWLFMVFLGSPLSALPSMLDLQVHDLAFHLVLLVTRVAVVVLGGVLGDPALTILLYSLVGAVCWFGFVLWVMRVAEVGVGRCLTRLGAVSVRVGLGYAPCFVLLALRAPAGYVALTAVLGAGLGLAGSVGPCKSYWRQRHDRSALAR